MKIKLVLFLLLWSVLFYFIGIYTSNAECLSTATEIMVDKHSKTMFLYDKNGCKIKEYAVRIGIDGKKQCEGDKKTPEGTYHIIDKYGSKYVRFLALDYPNKQDRKNAKKLGCRAGSGIGIHYYNKEYSNDKSTLEHSLGCITVWTKQEILEIYKLVKVGTKVVINK